MRVASGWLASGFVEVLCVAVAGVQAVFEFTDDVAVTIGLAAQVRSDMECPKVVEVKCRRVSTRGEVAFVEV